MANTCTGDCLKCALQQQVYCSAQRSYALLENQRAIVERLDHLETAVSSITAHDIIPLEENTTQIPAGVENRAEPTV